MSSGGGGKSTSTTVQELSPEQRQLLQPVIPVAEQFVKSPPTDYPGQRIAPFSQQELEAQRLLASAVPMLNQQSSSANQGLNFLTSGAVLDPRTNPGLQGAIDAAIRPITENYTRNVMPSIGRNAVSAGQYGGTAMGKLEQQAASDYGRSIGDTSSKIVLEGYNQGLDAMSRGLYALPTVQQSSLASGQLLSALGEQQRAMEQAQIDEAVRKYTTEQLLPWMAAKEVAGVAFGIPGGTSATEAVGAQPSGNYLMSGLGGAASGAAIGSVVPGVGTAAGAGVGGVLGLLSAFMR